MPEVAGEAALYMKNPDDAEDLAGILKRLAENPSHRREWAEKGVAQAGRFSWRKTADRTFKAFDRALGEQTRNLSKSNRPVTIEGDVSIPVEPLRVVVGSQFLNVEMGGAEKYIHEVCSRLESRHGMILTYLSADGLGAPGLSGASFRFMSSGFHHAWRKEIQRALLKIRPHVVYVHHTVPWISDVLLYVANDLKIPAVIMYHSDVTGPELRKKTLGFLYYHFIARRSFNLCEAFMVPSKTFARGSPHLDVVNRKIIAAPPGVDSVMAEGRRRRKQPYVLFIGKPQLKSKGLYLLLRAFKRLRAQRPDLELVVVGRTEKGDRKSEDPGVRYVGYVASRRELADWYASALVTVLPSTVPGESFGMVLAEALMAGCPVVGPRMGGVPELVENGLNGYLFSPEDVPDLVKGITLAMEHQTELRNHIEDNRERYRKRFDWDRTAEIVAHALRSVVRGNRMTEGG